LILSFLSLVPYDKFLITFLIMAMRTSCFISITSSRARFASGFFHAFIGIAFFALGFGAFSALRAQVVTTFAGQATAGLTDNTGVLAQFSSPAGMAIDAADNIYLVDRANNCIRFITPAAVVTTLAGNGTADFANGMGATARFAQPNAITINAAGTTLFIADAGNHRIRQMTAGGDVTTLSGQGTGGFNNGPVGAATRFNFPHGAAVRTDGSVYIADFLNHRIRLVTPAGAASTFAGSGTPGLVNGTGGAADFNLPIAVALDGAGNLFVADAGNHCIRRITPAGVVTTFAGNGTPGYADGTGTAARFNYPSALALDASGNVYVADQNNHRIRKITPTGVVTTLAGSGIASYFDATGTSAHFNQPAGIAVNAAGTVFVSDQGNNRIRAISPPPPPTVTSFAPMAAASGATVTITGTNFTGVGAVTFGGVPAASFTVDSPTQITAVVGAGGASGAVEVTGPGGVGSLAGFTFIDPPVITSFTPVNGGAATVVTITGMNFTGATAVSFGGTPAAGFTVVNATTITATVAAGSGSGVVAVTGPGGTAHLPGFTYFPPPAITSFAPTSSVSGGMVVITGTNFTGATVVRFGGINATSYTVDSPTQITAVVGAGASGNVQVITPGGTANLAGFTFIPMPVITSFTPTSAGPGMVVTINGTGLSGATAVSFGGFPATILTNTATVITAQVSVAGGTGVVSVTTPGGTANSAGMFTFFPTPTITSFTPMTAAAGNNVVITGTNFTGATAVSFGGVAAASYVVDSPTQITAVVSAGGATGNVQVTTPGGTATQAGFTFIFSPPAITSFAPTSNGQGGTVVITGANFTGATAVSFGGVPAASFTVVSPTQINAVVAAGGATGNVQVTTPGGMANLAGFTFIPSPTITSFAPMAAAAGNNVVITGTNFTGATLVRFGGINATSYTVDSPTQITAVVSAGGATGNVQVTTPGGTATQAGFTFIFSPPTITGFTPLRGPGGGVTITGTNFTGATAVSFGGVPAASFTVVSPTQINAVVAAGGATGNVQVSTPGGTVNSASAFTFVPRPTITGFSPTNAGNMTVVTITGNNFMSGANVNVVRFGATYGAAIDASSFTVDSDTQITATVGSGATGSVWVQKPDAGPAPAVPVANRRHSLAGFTYFLQPTITTFAPAVRGPGMTVTITGTNFTGATAVSFGGVPAAGFTVDSPTQITATIAAGATGSVAVTTPGGTAIQPGFTFVPAPTITMFTPASAMQGNNVVITGTNFTGATAVSFGGVPAASFTVDSPTQITAVVGAGASGNVEVTTPGGTATQAGFTFLLTPPTVTSFNPPAQGAGGNVIITGTHFTGATAVSFGGVPAASFTVDSPTQITAVVGAGASGNVEVTTPGGTGSLAGFLFSPPPTITSFSPTSQAAGATVIITGTNFTGATAVSFGGVPAMNFTVDSPTQISCAVGAGASGAVSVTTPGGTATLGGFTYVFYPPTITSFTPTNVAFGGTVLINGTNFIGATAVSFGGVPATSFTVISPTLISAVVGAGASGNVSITTPGGTATLGGFTFVPAPVISMFSPTVAGAGATVTITGSGFTSVTDVLFGGVSATSFIVDSPTQIRAVVAPGSASGLLQVVALGGTGSLAGFGFAPPPTITSFMPATATPGANVSINGTGLDFTTGATLGGVPVASFIPVNPTLVVVVVGTGATGVVRVTTPGGSATLAGFTFMPLPPVIDSISPALAGPGMTVTIHGAYLVGATAVSFGGVPATSFTIVSPTQITAVVGASGASGAVSVTTPGGTANLPGFTFVPAPVITSFAPTNAPIGETVTIFGSNFTGASEVRFGGATAASFTIISPTQINAVVSSTAASGSVQVTTPGGTGALGGFVLIPPPVITGILPIAAGPGLPVVINGANFANVASVRFGGVHASSFVVNSPTQITAIISTGATGSVMVTTTGGTASFPGFTFVLPPVITSFTPAVAGPGMPVRINGENFTGASSVTFGNVTATAFTVNSPTQITAVVAPAGASGAVSLATPGGVASLAGFTFVPAPTITGFSPTSGEPGTVVTITGTNLSGTTSVNFGSVSAASFTVVSPTEITAVVPGAAGSIITLSTPGGSASLGGFMFLPAPTISGFMPASAGPGATVTITGTNLSNVTAVSFGGVPAESFTAISPTQITAVLSANGASGAVSVTTPDGVATRDGFIFVPSPPTITNFSPSRAGMGALVTITGTNFIGVSSASFGNVPATSFTVASPTEIRAVVGTGASGSVAITTNGGSASMMGFTFVPPPTIAGFSASNVLVGDTITITGTNLSDVTSVTFGGVAALGFERLSDTTLRAVVSASGQITVTSPGGSASIGGFTAILSPIILGFSPASAAKDSVVIIRGLHFTGATSVRFGGVTAASFTVVSPTEIRAVVGTGATGSVSVTTTGGTASLPGFNFLTPPSITGISPALAGAGVEVRIIGASLSGATAVSFGGVPAASFRIVSPTEIIAVVPNGAASGSVEVTTPAGVIARGGFMFIPAPTITSFEPRSGGPGLQVEIRGANLSGVTAVRFGGVTAASFTVLADTLIRAVVSEFGSTGSVTLSSPGGFAEAEGFVFVPPAPTITSFAPTAAAAGDTVVITGMNFIGVTAVRFGGVAALRFTAESSTRIIAVVGSGASGNVSVSTMTGLATRAGFTLIEPPLITSFTPQRAGRGASVTVNGANFISVRSVQFGGVEAESVVIISPTQIRAVVSSGATGVVRVQTPAGSATRAGFTFIPAPLMRSFSPQSAGAGASVLIRGAHFTDASAVSFGGVAAERFTVEGDTLIRAVVAANSRSGAVAVTTPGGMAMEAGFTFIPAPTILSFSPTSAGTGTPITIIGANFTGATAVRFGGVPASSFNVVSPTQIIAVLAPNSVSGSVTVVTPTGTAVLSGFTVLPSPLITSFAPTKAKAGETISIFGSRLAGAVSVQFGGVEAERIVSVSDTLVTAVVSKQGASGSVSVRTPGGIGSRAGFAFIAQPVITGFTPAEAGGGRVVTILGDNFTDATAVSFGGVPATRFTVVSPTQITAFVGASGASGDVAITTPGGSARLGGFRFIPAPTIASFSPESGAIGASVAVTGTNFGSITGVAIGGVGVPFRVNNEGQISLVIPLSGVTTGSITVVGAGGVAVSTEIFRFIPPPSISSATFVQSRQGIILRIMGVNLGGATQVKVGRTIVPHNVVNPTQVTASIPPGAQQNDMVVVTTPGGVAYSTGSRSLPFISSVSPLRGRGGDRITLKGGGLGETNGASIGGVETAFNVQSDEEVVLTVPSAGAFGVIGLNTPAGVVTTTSLFTFITPQPLIVSFSPSQGDVGERVRVLGENFTGATAVFVGGFSVPFTVVNAEEITLTIPADGVTSGNIVVVGPTGIAISTARFLFTPGGVAPALPEPPKQGAVKCYPNPAADNITIAYSLPEPQNVSIRVVNALGNTVSLINEGAQEAGEHEHALNIRAFGHGAYLVIVQTQRYAMQASFIVAR
jgi:sugar lactone lactonase YvrE